MSQRLSLQEVQEIARMASKRKAVLNGTGPTVDKLADALGLHPAQVDLFLREIRDTQAGLSPDGDRTELKRSLIGAGIAMGVLLLLVLGNFVAGALKAPPVAAAQPTSPVANPTASFIGRPAEAVVAPALPPVASTASAPWDSGLSQTRVVLPSEDFKDSATSLDHAYGKAKAHDGRGEPVVRRAD